MSEFEPGIGPYLRAARMPEPEPEDPGARRRRIAVAVGAILIGAAVLAAVVVSVLPAPYVIERPGPTFDVLGDVEVDGETLPLISIPTEETFPTDGSLRMTTVTLTGNPEQLPSWIEVLGAWFDRSVAVLPVDEVFAPGTTVEQTTEQSRIEMENSQEEAIAAALGELEVDVDGQVLVAEVVEGSPVEGILERGDVIVSFAGEEFEDVSGLREAINDSGAGVAAPIVYERDGEQLTAEVTPILAEDGETAVLSIYVSSDYDFPFTVEIELQNVGGPSAGMMFALGIIDKLVDESITGGEDIAGTGTITADGEVGPIGGIRQKLYGAQRAGADWFLAPESNCDEVVGHEPEGLTVISVSTLDDALDALESISAGEVENLPSCDAVVG